MLTILEENFPRIHTTLTFVFFQVMSSDFQENFVRFWIVYFRDILWSGASQIRYIYAIEMWYELKVIVSTLGEPPLNIVSSSPICLRKVASFLYQTLLYCGTRRVKVLFVIIDWRYAFDVLFRIFAAFLLPPAPPHFPQNLWFGQSVLNVKLACTHKLASPKMEEFVALEKQMDHKVSGLLSKSLLMATVPNNAFGSSTVAQCFLLFNRGKEK